MLPFCHYRHYNKDERMVPLMERIAWELAERVTRVINVRTIFHETPDHVMPRYAGCLLSE